MSKCMCGAYDCRFCYPVTYKAYIAQDEEEEEDTDSDEKNQGSFEDEDVSRYRDEGRER